MLPGTWLAFSLDHNEDMAAQRYTDRYGQPPEQIIAYMNLLRLGPVEEAERATYCQASFFPSGSAQPPTTPPA
jgi:hypothetical protein